MAKCVDRGLSNGLCAWVDHAHRLIDLVRARRIDNPLRRLPRCVFRGLCNRLRVTGVIVALDQVFRRARLLTRLKRAVQIRIAPVHRNRSNPLRGVAIVHLGPGCHRVACVAILRHDQGQYPLQVITERLRNRRCCRNAYRLGLLLRPVPSVAGRLIDTAIALSIQRLRYDPIVIVVQVGDATDK